MKERAAYRDAFKNIKYYTYTSTTYIVILEPSYGEGIWYCFKQEKVPRNNPIYDGTQLKIIDNFRGWHRTKKYGWLLAHSLHILYTFLYILCIFIALSLRACNFLHNLWNKFNQNVVPDVITCNQGEYQLLSIHHEQLAATLAAVRLGYRVLCGTWIRRIYQWFLKLRGRFSESLSLIYIIDVTDAEASPLTYNTVFIKYCFFRRFYNIPDSCLSLFSLGLSVCTHTRQVEHHGCSRTGNVQKNHKILREKHNN